ncbi:MAG TPA: hypothetical protein VFT94_07355 [Gaiellaceae bacterium]|nr:hypothetical protein [Gaiellaceae bacterium]
MLALALPAPAAAHVVATPSFLASESSVSIGLEVPNERSDPMTSFTLTAPDGLVIEHAHAVPGWDGRVEDGAATWTGGSLAAKATVTLGITLRADVAPGTVTLGAKQGYDSGAVVEWPVSLTVTPAEESPSENLALAGVVGLIGVLVVVAVAVFAWRRRSTPGSPGDDT